MSLVLRLVGQDQDGGKVFDLIIGPYGDENQLGQWLHSNGFSPLSGILMTERKKPGRIRNYSVTKTETPLAHSICGQALVLNYLGVTKILSE